MSKQPTPPQSQQPPEPVQSDALAALRVQIDTLDRQLLELMNQRARVAEQVG